MLPRFRTSLVVIDEFLPFMYNPAGHPRAAQMAASMGLPPPAGEGEEPPLVALRYRAERVLVVNEGSPSDLL